MKYSNSAHSYRSTFPQHPLRIKQPLTFPLDLAPLHISAQTVAQLCSDPHWGSTQLKINMGGESGATEELA